MEKVLLPLDVEDWTCQTVGKAEIETVANLRDSPFIRNEERVLLNNKLYGDDAGTARVLLERAGVRQRMFYRPESTKVGIVTCGGLCPGLNSVIRSLVMGLFHGYGVTDIIGYKYGFEGLNKDLSQRMPLSPERVKSIHKMGGTILGTSRGPQSVDEMVKFLVSERVNVLFCIGGDGTLRGAAAIAAKAGKQVSVIGIPKTIDNDVAIIDKSFGFDTACEEAVRAINAGHAEAHSHQNGVAIIKLMGRDSGFISLYAALSSGDVNFVLLPEVCVEITGFVSCLRDRLIKRSHAVIVVAEGACQQMVAEFGTVEDASGNTKSEADIGPFLKALLSKELKDLNPTIKLIDPSYQIRAGSANAGDQVFCSTLAQMSVHAAMAGYTAAVVGHCAGHFALIPIDKISAQPRKIVDINGSAYQTLLDSTGMPSSIFR